ncbi:hypothetical protein BN7_5761 [Wickerhamomyces ciferrii]|uniref:GTP-binding protein RHO4 n=1 Tax=Wickerhamomyces ciferrii (strain ATCC 14091 / BCRC 22168 / CBS 111 / JCM 3599 / NBRC 0793 / NRRL Y-1031 F-60-10) TaxID=1206466 RepID=K0KW17_WICCF|nr:uncharacterized protein BN7_5761 [Wickerhamomyces ciferrii]CCH46172.1 hypothetical protein BN7_5761 [Wickerhamomyces ciferrii]
MNTLQSRPYNNNKNYIRPVKDFTDSTSKATSDDTAYETPYDIAKKRQSQLTPEQPTQSTFQSPAVERALSEVPQYELDAQRKKADFHIKLVVVGDGGCGKTCLLISYSQGEFPTVYVPTIFENYVTNVKGPKGKVIELALWDTAGQEEYDRLRPLSYPDVNILLVCYAINNITSLQNVKETWTPEVKHFCPGIPIILVGTKMDLTSSSDSSVDFHEAEKVAQEIGASDHIRCSAKTTENVNHVFNVAIAAALRSIEASNATAAAENRKSMKNRFSRQFKKNEAIESRDASPPPPIYSDYFKNSEYGFDDIPVSKKKKRRCVIL